MSPLAGRCGAASRWASWRGDGGVGVVVRAGAAGLTVRARGRGGGVTVTVGTGTAGRRLRRRRRRWRSRGRGSFRRRRCRRWSLRRRCLRRCNAGEAKHHECRTAQKKQTPATDRHDTPQFLTRTTALTPDTRRITAKERRAASRRGRRCATSCRQQDRCQAMGGARARNRARSEAVKSNSAAASSCIRPKMLGSGREGASAGTSARARWMSAQIGQQSSASD